MAAISVDRAGPGRYVVTIDAGGTKTTHQVTVPAALLSQVGIPTADEERLVRASFEFLLEREPATSILSTFDLSVIESYFPGYVEDVRARLE
jgi:hypothetical protein